MWLRNIYDDMTPEQWAGAIGLVILLCVFVWFLSVLWKGGRKW